MFDSRALETAIGLVFWFLGFSLITTAIQEFLASALKLRAATFRSGLKSMIAEGQSGLAFYEKLISHPVISPAGTSPSYASAKQFSTAVLHLLGEGGGIPTAISSLRIIVQSLPDAPYKSVIVALFRDGETDLEKFEARLEAWYDQSMDRISGIYKRISQYISLGIGIVLAFIFQADAIGVAVALWNEPAKTNSAMLAGAIKAGQAQSMPTLGDFMPYLQNFRLGPIWQDWTGFHFSLSWFIGCMITAIAVSLGAPFWFDLLQSFISLRGTGPVPKDGTSKK